MDYCDEICNTTKMDMFASGDWFSTLNDLLKQHIHFPSFLFTKEAIIKAAKYANSNPKQVFSKWKETNLPFESFVVDDPFGTTVIFAYPSHLVMFLYSDILYVESIIARDAEVEVEYNHSIRPGFELTKKQIDRELTEWANSIVCYLVWLTQPTNHVVEVKPCPLERKKYAKRYPERPIPSQLKDRYIIIDKREIKVRWKNSHGGAGAPKIPHFRRGHWRQLESERYTHKKGKRIWIPPTEIGTPSIEWKSKRTKYKVIA